MSRIPRTTEELKAAFLCEGARPDAAAAVYFERQNPTKMKRGGGGAGGWLSLTGGMGVNTPVYTSYPTNIRVVADETRQEDQGINIRYNGELVGAGKILPAPSWYQTRVGDIPISRILTAHARQLAGSIYEDCGLFPRGEACTFCVMAYSQGDRRPELISKSGALFVEALRHIPLEDYDGLDLNGGTTFHDGRGLELMLPPIQEIRRRYPKLKIFLEIAPPNDLTWIDRAAEAGVDSLMMNLECWDDAARQAIIPGKNKLCPKDLYFRAFERGITVLGKGKVSTCFIVGTEPLSSLKEGLGEVVKARVIPSPCAARHHEDVPGFTFTAKTNWADFYEIGRFTSALLKAHNLVSTDAAGCAACGLCDLVNNQESLRNVPANTRSRALPILR